MIIDSGCTAHICPYLDSFTSYTPIDPVSISAANKTSFAAIGRRDVELAWPNRKDMTRLILRNVLHCPSTTFALVSMSAMNCAGYSFALDAGHLHIRAPKGERIANVPVDDGLYRIQMSEPVAAVTTGGELLSAQCAAA